MSAHARALAALGAWTAPDADQAALRDQFVRHLVAHPDGLRRSCFPGHLTAGALVLSPGLDAVLLNLHGKAGRWFHFGGHGEDADASLLDTARREAAEESGIPDVWMHPEPVHLSRHAVAFCDRRGIVDHLDVRFAAVATPGSENLSDESLALRWWPLSALPDLDPDMLDLIARSRERLQSPRPSSRAPIE